MKKLITVKVLCQENIIGVKSTKEKRVFNNTIGAPSVRTINRTKYLKICWYCGEPYESRKYNTYACSPRCIQNMVYMRNRDINPPANMAELTKPKNVKEIKERFGYR